MSISWSVASTIDEPLPLVLAYVAHHLSLGASEIFIYLDRPSDEAKQIKAVLDTRPEVFCLVTDADYWQKNGGRRPHDIPKRQRVNATNAYRMTTSDWLLHSDSDEYLCQIDAVMAGLQKCADTDDFLLLPVAERVHLKGESRAHIFSVNFRVSVGHEYTSSLREVYGKYAEMLENNVAGHSLGKSFFRTGRGMIVGLHTPNEAGVRDHSGARLGIPALLHFDGLTEESYLRKLRRRIDSGHGPEKTAIVKRKMQLQFFKDNMSDTAGLAAFYDGLKSLTSAQETALRVHGWLVREKIDPASEISRFFPSMKSALTAKEFDDVII